MNVTITPAGGLRLDLACGCWFVYRKRDQRPLRQGWCDAHRGMWPLHRKPLVVHMATEREAL